ncbi:PREDICTED: uncharacterized protein LOC105460311, partial [Wasmannia auropunctata]|uniref:uncharacterized protein LOC105460311 n=1 Tax=Wasmannia auropunctata TaxID=64793 RepID=UPI0005EFB46D
MLSVRKCLDSLLSHNITGFTNETEMINTYLRSSNQKPLTIIVAGVVFEQYNEPTLKYKLRHRHPIPHDLYQSVSEMELNTRSPLKYFNWFSPLAQIQICVDEAFIKKVAPNSNVKMSIQQMPYPPHIEIDRIDTMLRIQIVTFAVM